MEGDHILFCDRESAAGTVGDKAAAGLTSIYEVRGLRAPKGEVNGKTYWSLELSKHICYCKACRDGTTGLGVICPYADDIRATRTIEVNDEANDPAYVEKKRALDYMKTHFKNRGAKKYVKRDVQAELNRLKVKYESADTVAKLAVLLYYHMYPSPSGQESVASSVHQSAAEDDDADRDQEQLGPDDLEDVDDDSDPLMRTTEIVGLEVDDDDDPFGDTEELESLLFDSFGLPDS